MKNQLRNEIIGPLTPEEKAEIREILLTLAEVVEGLIDWNMDDCLNVGYSENVFVWLSFGDQTPTISFTEFKEKYHVQPQH